MLEASFDQRGGPDDWTCQLLESAASLAGILLEAERLGTTPARLTSAERDGAAPLIGSSDDHGQPSRAGRARGLDRLHRLDRRRKRRRQRAGGAADSRAGPATAWAVRRDQLRRAGRDADRSRIVRHRRADRDRGAGPPGQVRARRWRHVVPRRDLRPVDGGAGQAAARDPGPHGRARRRQWAPAHQHAHCRRHQSPAGRPGRSRAVPRRPVLSAERRRDSCPAVATAQGGHSRARALLSGASRGPRPALDDRRRRPTR